MESQSPLERLAPVLGELQTAIEQQLGECLIGLYLYGSLVLGDFDEQRSDVDLLAVTSELVRQDQLEGLRRMHADFVAAHPVWEDRVEVAYMPDSVLRTFKSEQGTVARICPGESLHLTTALPHWLIDLYSVQEHGLVRSGPPIDTILPHISKEEFVHTVRDGIAQWRGWAKESTRESFQCYAVIALCRSLYACKHGDQASKVVAAKWACEHYPEWSGVIHRAMEWRQTNSAQANQQALDDTLAFVEFVDREA